MLTFAAVLIFSASALSQSAITLHGTVIDSETHTPLIGANILVIGDSSGTSTDINGKFELRLNIGPQWLKISYIGYSTKQVVIDVRKIPAESLVIELEVDPLQTESVIVEEELPDTRYVPQEITLSRKMIVDMVTTTPDVYQSVKKLPGVHTISDKSAEFNVRGSHFDEHLTTIGGIPVARPFHLKSGSYESISIFNPEMIKKIEFYPGNFPVTYGWKMSSAMELEYRQGSRDSLMFTTSVNTMRTNVVVEGPLKKSGSWIVGIRKSYLDYWFKNVRPFENGQGDFFDLQSKVRYDKSNNMWFEFITIAGLSGYEQVPGNHSYILSTQLFKIIKNVNSNEKDRSHTLMQTAKMSYLLSPESIVTLTGAMYRESNNESSMFFKESRYVEGSESLSREYQSLTETDNNFVFTRLYLRGELEHKLSEAVVLTAGTELMFNEMDNNLELQSVNYGNGGTSEGLNRSFNQSVTQQMISGYAGLVYNPNDGLFIYPGLRTQYDKLTSELNFNISTSFSALTSGSRKIIGGLGVYHQPPSYVEFMSTSIDSTTEYRNQKTVQGSLGIQWKRANGGHFKIEGYSKYSPDIIPYVYEEGRYDYELWNTGKAFSLGFDVSLSGTMNENVHGSVSYGFMRSREKIESESSQWIPRTTDRQHSLNLGLIHTVNPKTGLRFIFNFTVGHGFPFTAKNLQQMPAGTYELVPDERNKYRYKPYKRLDIRWARDLKNAKFFGSNLNGDVYLEIVNIWNMRNTLKYNWEYFGVDTVKRIPTFLTPRMYGGGFRLKF